jgi:hypothetical protein
VTNSIDAIFALQKQFVFRIFDQLGIALTPAERQLVDRQATTNLDAFLAYSRGLAAADDGRFEDAARFFDNARTLDPNFSAAAARFGAAQAAAAGVQVTSATLQSGLTGTEAQTVTGAENGEIPRIGGGLTNTLTNVAQTVNPPAVAPISNTVVVTQVLQEPPPPNRDAPSNTGGTDTPVARTGTVTIVIRRP